MNNTSSLNPVWKPSSQRIRKSQIYRYLQQIIKTNPDIKTYNDLYKWSIDNPELFWENVAIHGNIIFSKKWSQVLRNGHCFQNAKWFLDSKLNFAQNLLKRQDDKKAIIFDNESGEYREYTYAQINEEVKKCAFFLKKSGVGIGDRVAALMPNTPETVIAMLATTSLGAIWTACAPDFGENAVLERFSQTKPKVLFSANGYRYANKKIDLQPLIKSIKQKISSIEYVVIDIYSDLPMTMEDDNYIYFWHDIRKTAAAKIKFTQLPFDHPLYILYSSGTTGKPKCIVHSAGGTLIQHIKEHQLHVDLTANDVFFYYTTCGWMMWNWLISGLASGCTIVLYDGSPLFPNANVLWNLVQKTKTTIFGTSATYIGAQKKIGSHPSKYNDFSSLHTILSSGSPLLDEHFDYVYNKVKPDLLLSSISGGTDIVSCFVLGNPMLPVYRGEIQCRGLGMAVEVFVDGKPKIEQQGELVCVKPFPCVPLGFWNEKDTNRFHNAYFSKFEKVWTHGDFATLKKNGGIIIHGRSDSVLNPGGIRIGTAEIYRELVPLLEIEEAVCIGQKWKNDVRIVLFVVLTSNNKLDQELKSKIKKHIAKNASKRHVPKKIIHVPDIPRTRNGKISEIAVRNAVQGEPINNISALSNPNSIKYFQNITELKL